MKVINIHIELFFYIKILKTKDYINIKGSIYSPILKIIKHKGKKFEKQVTNSCTALNRFSLTFSVLVMKRKVYYLQYIFITSSKTKRMESYMVKIIMPCRNVISINRMNYNNRK